jgi:hypothetical protein
VALPAVESQCVFCVEKAEIFKYYLVEFESGPDNMGFVVDKVALGLLYLRVLRFTLIIITTPMFHTLLQRLILTEGRAIPEDLPTKVMLCRKSGSTKKGKDFNSFYCLPLPEGRAGTAWEPSDA